MASPKSTLPDSDKQQDDKFNPGEQNAEKQFGAGYVGAGLDQLESFANDPENATKKSVEEQEGNPDASWRSSYAGNKTRPGKDLSQANIKAILKKRGPLGLILAILLGGGVVGTIFVSPSVLLLQIREVMVEKFNVQLPAMNARYGRVIDSKVDSATNGLCGTKISVKCRYSTMSKAQVARFSAANITVEGGENALGRTKPTGFRFAGEVIPASEFRATMRSNPEFLNAVRRAYNPKFAGFADQIWARYARSVSITKAPNVDGNTDEERAKSIEERVRNGDTNASFKRVTVNDTNPQTGDKYTQPQADQVNAAADRAAGFSSEARAGGKIGTEAVEQVTTSIATGGGVALNAIKFTGMADTACQAYGAVQTLGYAAKTIRAIQLARYAFVFLNVADQIREGTADAGDVAYLGGILTEVAYDASSAALRVSRGSATDSFGYKFAAYGTGGKMSNFAMQFLAGGGLTGELINVTSTINSFLPGGAKATCGTLANPWVQAGSIIGGIALMLVPGAGQAISAVKITAQVALQVTLQVGLFIIPELLKDIVAGNVTDGIVGPDSGDAITSGAGNLMGDLSNLAPMTKEDALAYAGYQNDVVAMYAKEETATLSPLDPSSRHTFVGSIVSSLLPVLTNTSNASLALTNMGSVFSQSLSSLIPKASAITEEQYRGSMELCQDYDYKALGIATDPFCNVIYGIPPQYLDKDTQLVIDELLAGGHIDETSGLPKSDTYKNFIKDCIERTQPLGSSGVDQQGNDGAGCIIDSSNANFYLFYVDERIDKGLEGYASETGAEATTKQELAAKIVAKGNVTYREADGPVLPKLEDIANGNDANSFPCGMNINILRALDVITDSHSIQINDFNRVCEDALIGNASSRHRAGNGSAVDIGAVDGATATGRDAGSLAVIALIQVILSEAAQNTGSYSQIGQSQCGSNPDTLPGVVLISDSCDHLHFDVPPESDPDLEHN